MNNSHSVSKRRILVQGIILVLIAFSFWGVSRYPALFYEARRAKEGTLLERHLGRITKGEMISTEGEERVLVTIGKTTLNWVDTNKIGMSFGIVFGGAFLALLSSVGAFRNFFAYRGVRGSLVGMLVGIPLGICANCVAPFGLAMKRSGASLETILSAMFGSPTLNIVGLFIILTVFPLALALTRIVATLFLIFVVTPLIGKLFSTEERKVVCSNEACNEKQRIQFQREPWMDAVRVGSISFIRQTTKLAVLVVPLMLLAGAIGATLITFFPLSNLVAVSMEQSQILLVVLASFVGALLPIPMLVDIILVFALMQIGLTIGPVAALLITMPSYSIVSYFIVGKYFSQKLAAALFVAVMGTGITGGLLLAGWSGVRTGAAPFINVIDESGIVKLEKSTGASWTDYNNDGYLDLFIFGLNSNVLYRNNHNGTFSEVFRTSGVMGGWSGVFGDFNNDGCPDMYIAVSGGRDHLYKNNCDDTFRDVTEEAGIQRESYQGRGVAWADYNNDGYLDLYVANWGVQTSAKGRGAVYVFEPNILYRNNGDETFTDVTEEAKVTASVRENGTLGTAYCSNLTFVGPNGKPSNEDKGLSGYPYKPAFQPTWVDYDNDGNIDLFVAIDSSVSPLYRNNGDETFTDVTEEAGLCKMGTGMGVSGGDYDNDGDTDLYVTNTGGNYFWENNGDGTFSEVSRRAGVEDLLSLGWGAGFFDYDNDGYLDIYVVNGSVEGGAQVGGWNSMIGKVRLDRLYHNNGDGTFRETARDVGVYGDDWKEAAAFGDYDSNGFVDIVVISGQGGSQVLHRLYQNKGNKNNWLTVQLIGTSSNRDAVGAKIKLTAAGITQTRGVTSGSSYISQNSLWQTFGLGSAPLVDTIEIWWPSGTQTIRHNVKTNQRIVVIEGKE